MKRPLAATMACTAALVVVVVGIVVLKTACFRLVPREMAVTRTPRDGRPLGGRVAVVYSMHYGIHFAGLEDKHPFDINKYDRIYRALVGARLLRPEDVFVPAEATDEQLLLVHRYSYLKGLNRRPKVAAEALEQPAAALLPPSKVRSVLLNPFRRTTGGTILAAEQALMH
ncbi:MAG: hypothetical protein QF662_06150, partial [Phycisphaerae bacterium]|nr:hypothetical protein [Phycisphaerae bacterium]